MFFVALAEHLIHNFNNEAEIFSSSYVLVLERVRLRPAGAAAQMRVKRLAAAVATEHASSPNEHVLSIISARICRILLLLVYLDITPF